MASWNRVRGRALCLATMIVLLGPAPAPGHTGRATTTGPVPIDMVTAVAPGGVPWTWGGNGFGQLGDGTTQARFLPAPVSGLTDVTDLHGGREHVLALRSDGTAWVWGSSQQGQLGLGTTTSRSVPTQVPGLTGVTAVETGHNSSLALLADGTVRTWGLNADGQLGDGTTIQRATPVSVVGLGDAVAIAAGRDMAYAIRADGTVVAWGRNDEGQLGDGTTVRRTTPVRVGSLTDVIGIAGGRDHGLALRRDGTVWAWGSNDYGQVGDGTQTDRTLPVLVTTDALQVIAGAQHSYALRTDRTVSAWGRNYRANLGDATTTNRSRPVSVRDLTSVVSIGSGRDTGMAVLSDGRVMAWGHNATGQVGDGTNLDRTTPVRALGVDRAVLAGGGGAEYAVVLVGPTTSVPQDPVAAFTATCLGTSCSFDASGSIDPDGTVTRFDWTFGDATSGTGPTPRTTHDFAAAGTYTVTLTVTDLSGATGSTTHVIVVSDIPPALGPQWQASASSDANTVRPVVAVPGSVQAQDQLVLFVTTNRAATLTPPPGWTVLKTASDGTDLRSWILSRVAGPGLAGTSVRPVLDATSKTSLVLLAYRGAGPPSAWASASAASSSTSHTAPAATVARDASRVVRYYVDKSATPHAWTLAPSVTARATTTGSGSGLLTVATGDQPAAAGTAPPLAATAGVSSGKALTWTLVVPSA